MKDFGNRKMTRFAERTLDAFSSALLHLLAENRLEDITVGMLCIETNYPRSTFYNYFSDIYDLLEYCWSRIYDDLDLDGFKEIPVEVRTVTMFEKAYSYMDAHRDWINKAVVRNRPGDAMMQSLLQFIRVSMRKFFTPDVMTSSKQMRPEMLAEHYGNTVQMMLDWCFLRDTNISKQEALRSLDFLLGGIEEKLRD